MRFPTDMKLLWESIEWIHRHICRHCEELGIRQPRNKYADIAAKYLSYSKKRKRKASWTRMLKRRMIRLLEKLLIQRDGIHREYGDLLRYTRDYLKRLSVIRKVLVQAKELFEGRNVSDRIVSIDRHYAHPIVRGKGTKSVEFGAKVNSIQINGISFIETQKQHYSLSRIKARNRKTEILLSFFGIHTANAVLMIDKIKKKTVKAV